MKFDGGKQMFATDLEERMTDQGKFLEDFKFCVRVSPTVSIINARISKGRTGDIVEY
jgi:hypothetical protein